MRRLTGDPSADAYLWRLTARAEGVLGDALLGSYLVNSGARGDYLPGRSDLDVVLLVADAMSTATKHRVADALRDSAIPCPAPRLELVVYRRDVTGNPGARPPFELNLNSGPAIADHLAVDPEDEPWFWFALDLAAAADAALPVSGPPPAEVFASVPRGAVLEALLASHAWHAEEDTLAPNRVLNACRAWCWLVTSRWRSKSEAAGWAIAAGEDAELIRHALSLRAGTRNDPLPADGVSRLADRVAKRVAEA
jgi:hypothetical protein